MVTDLWSKVAHGLNWMRVQQRDTNLQRFRQWRPEVRFLWIRWRLLWTAWALRRFAWSFTRLHLCAWVWGLWVLLGRWTCWLGWAWFRGWLLWTAGRCRLFRLVDIDTKHLTPVENNSMVGYSWYTSQSPLSASIVNLELSIPSLKPVCPPNLYSLLVRHTHWLGCMAPTEGFFSPPVLLSSPPQRLCSASPLSELEMDSLGNSCRCVIQESLACFWNDTLSLQIPRTRLSTVGSPTFCFQSLYREWPYSSSSTETPSGLVEV